MPVRTRPPTAPASALGTRVRTLRLARGLTQAELAGDDFTKGFISLVETGRSSISMHAAEVLSARLGVTVADLISPSDSKQTDTLELSLLRGEQALTSGRPAEAIEIARKLTHRSAGLLRGRFQRLHARALNETTPGKEAIHLLDEALRQFRASRNRELAVRTLFDLAVAHGRLGQTNDALHLALECERALNANELVDRTFELQVLTYLARVFVELGDHTSGDLRAERAAKLAQDVSDPRTLAQLYESLSETREEQGDLEASLLYARRSLEMNEQLGRDNAIAITWNTIGWIYVQRKQYGRAAEALDRAERMARTLNNNRLSSYVLQTRAELAMAQGNLAEAVSLADESVRLPGGSVRARAISLLVKAEAIAKRRGSAREIDAAFKEAIAAMKNLPRRVQAKAHSEYADALAARGRAKEAFAAAKAALELHKPALG